MDLIRIFFFQICTLRLRTPCHMLSNISCNFVMTEMSPASSEVESCLQYWRLICLQLESESGINNLLHKFQFYKLIFTKTAKLITPKPPQQQARTTVQKVCCGIMVKFWNNLLTSMLDDT